MQTRIAQMLDQVSKLPHVSQVVSPYSPAGRAQVSRDGKIAFANVVFDKRSDLLPLSAIKKVISTAQGARAPGLQVELGGQAIQQAEVAPPGSLTGIGVLAAVVVLLISFGSFLAMGLPIVTALFGLGTGAALIGLGTHVIDMADFSLELAAMIGLGVGIDYSLFILTRYREIYGENGGDVREAVLLAMDTSGRAVLFAGATVMIALLGMFALGVSFLYGLSIAAVIAVLMVLIASLTLLPALLTFFGHKVGQPGRIARRIARRRERRQRPARPRFWARWIGGIQRHPCGGDDRSDGASCCCSARPRWRCDSGPATPATTRHRSRRARRMTSTRRASAPASTARSRSSPTCRGRTRRRRSRSSPPPLKRTPDVVTVTPPQLNPAGDTAIVNVYPRSSPQSKDDEHARAAPAQRRHPAGREEHERGDLRRRRHRDLHRLLKGALEQAVAVHRRDRRAVGAAARGRVPVARDPDPGGRDEPALDRRGARRDRRSSSSSAGSPASSSGPIEAFLPVLMFAIVFGLSMDYEVFLVSRIHEEWTRTHDATLAVRDGLIETGRVITAAAAVMVVVFSLVHPRRRTRDRAVRARAGERGLPRRARDPLHPAARPCCSCSAIARGRSRSWLDRRLPRLALEHDGPVPTHQPVLDD